MYDRHATDQVSTWIVNDGDYYDHARAIARRDGTKALAVYAKRVIKTAHLCSAPWQVRQELSNNDLDSVDWDRVVHELL